MAVHRPGRGGGLAGTPSTPGATKGMFGGFTSPQSGMAHITGLTSALRHSPHTHGFGGVGLGHVRFDKDVTVRHFEASASMLGPISPPLHHSSMHLDSSMRSADLAAAIKPGSTPILPEERGASFSQWCSSSRTRLRTRLNESEDLRRKSVRGLSVSSLSPGMGGVMVGLQDSRSNLDPRRSSVGQSWGGGGSPGMGLSRSLSHTSSPADRWWLSQPDAATDYCFKILSERGGARVIFSEARTRALAPQTSHGLEPAAALLEQTARGVRRWIGYQVVRHVISLMDQIEHDAAKGLHQRSAPRPAAAGTTPAALGGFGAPAVAGGFGAPALGGAFGAPAAGAGGFAAPNGFGVPNALQQQTPAAVEMARQEEEEVLKRANALDRREQVFLTHSRCASCYPLSCFPPLYSMVFPLLPDWNEFWQG